MLSDNVLILPNLKMKGIVDRLIYRNELLIYSKEINNNHLEIIPT